MMTQTPAPRGVQFVEVLEILEELNVQADRLKKATANVIQYQRDSEGGTPDADDRGA